MNGITVPVDASASKNVHASADHRILVYEATQEQELWKRWARGDYSTDDESVAQAWRDGLDRVSMKAVGARWRVFIDEHIGRTSDVEEIVTKVDRLLARRDAALQTRLLAILIAFLRGDVRDGIPFAIAYGADARVTLAALAPYSASILRLYLTFLACIAYNLVRLLPSNYVDLQYLFYAPFCMGFASNDNLHKRLWPAASGPAIFIDGLRLKDDLAKRAAWRAALSEAERDAHHETHSYYPVEIDGSIVGEVWAKSMKPRHEIVQRLKERPSLEEVEAEIGPKLRRMIDEMNALKAKKPADAGEWPLGPRPGTERPEP